MRPGCLGSAAAWGLGVLGLAGPLDAQPAVTDARAIARAGLAVTRVLESSPGAIRSAGRRLRFDFADLHHGTGIVVGCAGAEVVGVRAGFAAALVGLWSPVGEAHTLRCGGQLRFGRLRAGMGLDVHGVALERYALAWEIVPRVGCGWSVEERVTIAALAERSPAPGTTPRGALALEVRIAPGIEFGVQFDRQPGIPVALRFGVSCRAEPLLLCAGFESSTQSSSLGFSWSWDRQEIAWGSSTHPALGWSHAWTYAVSY